MVMLNERARQASRRHHERQGFVPPQALDADRQGLWRGPARVPQHHTIDALVHLPQLSLGLFSSSCGKQRTMQCYMFDVVHE